MSDFGHLADKIYKLEQSHAQLEAFVKEAVQERDRKIEELHQTCKEQGDALLESTRILERLVNILDPMVE